MTEIITICALAIVSLVLGTLLFITRRDVKVDEKQKEKEISLLEKQNALSEATADRVLEQNAELSKINSELTQKNTELQEENSDLNTLNQECIRFVQKVHGVLSEDIGFLNGELAQKLSLDIPEVRTLHLGLQRLRDDITAIKEIVEEFERVKNE